MEINTVTENNCVVYSFSLPDKFSPSANTEGYKEGGKKDAIKNG